MGIPIGDTRDRWRHPRLLGAQVFLLLLALLFPGAARAQDGFTFTLPATASVVMGDPFAELNFTLTNDGSSVGQIKFFTVLLPDTPPNADFEWIRDFGDPPGWEHKQAFKTYELTLEPLSQIPPGASLDLQTFVSGPNGGPISASAGDRQQCILSAEAIFTGGNNGITISGAAAPCWTVRGLAAQVSAIPQSVAVGDVITVTLSGFNRTTTSKDLEPAGALTATGTAGVTLLSGPTPTSSTNVPAGGSASFTYTYQATSTGTVNFTGQVETVGLNPGDTGYASSDPVTSNEVVVGDFTATLEWTTLQTTSGQQVQVVMTVYNNTNNNIGQVSPDPLSAACSDATLTLASGPTPSIVPSLKRNSSAQFVWTYTVTGNAGDDYCLAGTATSANTGGSTNTAQTNPEGVLGNVNVQVAPARVASGSVNKEVCWTVGNTSGKPVSEVNIDIPAGWTFASASGGPRTPTPYSWNAVLNGSTVEFTRPSPSQSLANGGVGEFCVTFSQVPTVTGDTPYSFPVNVVGAAVDISPITQVTVTANRLQLTASPAGPLAADGVASYEVCGRYTNFLTALSLDLTAGNTSATDATGSADYVAAGIVAGDLVRIEDDVQASNQGIYVIQAVGTSSLTLDRAPGASQLATTAAAERPLTGQTIAFTANSGSLSSTTATADTTGLGCVTLTGPPSTTDVTTVIQGQAGTATDLLSVGWTGVTGPNLLFVGGTLTPTSGNAGTTAFGICVDVTNTGTLGVTLNNTTALTITDTTGVTSTFTLTTVLPSIPADGSSVQLCFLGDLDANHVNGVSNLLQLQLRGIDAGAAVYSQDRPVDDPFEILNGTLAQVATFTATPHPTAGGVVVTWTTAGEQGTRGFHVDRVNPDGSVTRLTTSLVPGAGTTDLPQTYVFHDASASPGETYLYRIVEEEFDGDVVVHEAEDQATASAAAAPTGYAPVTLPGQASRTGAGLRILESGPAGYLVELRTERFLNRRVRRGGWGFDILDVAGYPHARVGETGKPQLPVVGHLLPRPAGTVPVVLSVEVETETHDGILPLPVYDSVAAQRDGVTIFGNAFRRDEAFYSQPGLYPAAWAEVADVGYAGDTPLLRLRLHPLRVRAASEQLEFARVVRVRIGFAPGGSGLPDAPQPLDTAVAAARASSAAPLLKLKVTEPGLHRVGLAALLTQEPSLATVPLGNWRLLHAGAEVPVRIEGTLADAGAYLEFVAAPRSSKWDATDVYWLASDAPGLRVEEAAPVAGTHPASATAVARRDEDGNFAYWAHVPGPDDYERWFLPGVATSSGPLSIAVDLPGLDAAGPDGTVAVRAASVTRTHDAPEQTLRLNLGAVEVDTHPQAGLGLFDMGGAVPASSWADPLTFELAPDATAGLLRAYVVDHVEVRYPRQLTAEGDHFRATLPAGDHAFEVTGFGNDDVVAYDLTDPATPRRLPVTVAGPGPYSATVSASLAAPGEVLVVAGAAAATPALAEDRAGDLPTPAGSVGYLALKPSAVTTQLAPLLAHREGEGLRTQVIDLEAVYDAWGDGRVSPVAIQRFLASTFAGWPSPAPRYLLLVGLASREPKHRVGAAFSDPAPLLAPTVFLATNFMGETGSDLRLATVWGADELPDFRVGRIPARSPEQVEAYVTKLLAYEALPPGDAFEERVVLVADDGEDGFAAEAVDTLQMLPPAVTATVARLGTDGDAATLRGSIRTAWEGGTALVDFSGHGGMSLWAEEDLLPMATTTSLAGAPRLPFVISRTCQDAYAHFHLSFFVSQIERLLFNANGGAIAAFASAGTSGLRSKERLADAFLHGYLTDGVRSAGDAVLAAQLQVLAEGASQEDALETHHLMGDPALGLVHPAPTSPRIYFVRRGLDGSTYLAWRANAESDLLGYRIYRGDTLLATLPPGTTSYTVPPPPANALTVAGDLTLSAVDAGGNESSRASVLAATVSSPATSLPGPFGGGGGGGCAAAPTQGPLTAPLLLLLGLPWYLRRRRAA